MPKGIGYGKKKKVDIFVKISGVPGTKSVTGEFVGIVRRKPTKKISKRKMTSKPRRKRKRRR